MPLQFIALTFFPIRFFFAEIYFAYICNAERMGDTNHTQM